LILDALSWVALALAGLFATVAAANLAVLRPPPAPRARRAVSVLIPARDEEANIGEAVEAALASRDVDLEVVVLDDGSTDRTGEIVEARAARDPRLRLIRGMALPPGWNGKQHACQRLGEAASHEVLVFLDADVRLAPGACARLAEALDGRGLDLVSGFPRQVVGTLAERLVVPQMNVLLLGYLPLPMARVFARAPGFAAGCGQCLMVRKAAWEAVGGHGAVRHTRHDGLMLPRAFRRAGLRTDLVDLTRLAACRMYRSGREVWEGFSKNATEGMAQPVALPVWTVLLLGGHVLPVVLALAAALGAAVPVQALWAFLVLLAARTAVALGCAHPPSAVALHPVGILRLLAIQWSALRAARRGAAVAWRGRSYET
jgi:cellulose synthase/poly-beta-1,6-N-acetylglucosamine synthase-like glycosyltransferase